MRTSALALAFTAAVVVTTAGNTLSTALSSALASAVEPAWTVGVANEISTGLIDCGTRSRVSAVGEIESADGTVWTVPAKTEFTTGPKAADLYNECGGHSYSSLKKLDTDKVPVADVGGSEEFTAYIFADNYFELYINGKLIGVDPVPFTPFNSNIVKFRVDRPFSIAVKMVDWEETLGLGMERGRGSRFAVGDGGLVAVIRDFNDRTVSITDEKWRAQTFYIAPIVDQNCLVIDGFLRDSSACTDQTIVSADSTSAAHWLIPQGWAEPEFNDESWPYATTYTNDTVGISNKKAYTNFRDVFDDSASDAQFIWSTNLLLDNLVLLRATVR